MNSIFKTGNWAGWIAGLLGREDAGDRARKARQAKTHGELQDTRRILICGASGAIGAAVAERFAAQGAQLYLHYCNHANPVEKLTSALLNTHPGLTLHTGQADLRDEAAAHILVQDACDRMGGIDVLVTAIDAADDKLALMTCSEDIHACMDANLRTVMNVCEAFKSLPRQGEAGRIVNISSVTGLVGQPLRVAHGAAKGAVISYTKSLARELAQQNITANTVAPQVVEGRLANLMKQQFREALLASTPVGRFCTPTDVAHAVDYLASPGASFVTGTVLTVAGGLVTW